MFINLDVTIIEIIAKDNISEEFFLLPNNDKIDYYEFEKKEIFVPKETQEGILGFYSGKIENVSLYDINYTLERDENIDLLGSPIFFKGSQFVIGINVKDKDEKNKIKNVNLIFPIAKSLKINLDVKSEIYLNGSYKGQLKTIGNLFLQRGHRREGFGKYTWKNGNCYIGQWSDDNKDGKGIYYFKDGTIYEGDFVKNIFEGKGKFTWEDGYY
jgi:hypothetical protein